MPQRPLITLKKLFMLSTYYNQSFEIIGNWLIEKMIDKGGSFLVIVLFENNRLLADSGFIDLIANFIVDKTEWSLK